MIEEIGTVHFLHDLDSYKTRWKKSTQIKSILVELKSYVVVLSKLFSELLLLKEHPKI